MTEKQNAEMLELAWQTAKVSIDVSTCDADAGRRVFGRVVDWQPEDYDGEKPLGLRLLCEYEGDNFGLRDAPPPIETAEQWSARWQKAKEEMANLPAGPDAVREALKPFAAVAEYDIGETESDADIYRPMSKNNRAPLLTVGDLRRAYAALLPAPQPQEKPTGDQT